MWADVSVSAALTGMMLWLDCDETRLDRSEKGGGQPWSWEAIEVKFVWSFCHTFPQLWSYYSNLMTVTIRSPSCSFPDSPFMMFGSLSLPFFCSLYFCLCPPLPVRAPSSLSSCGLISGSKISAGVFKEREDPLFYFPFLFPLSHISLCSHFLFFLLFYSHLKISPLLLFLTVSCVFHAKFLTV